MAAVPFVPDEFAGFVKRLHGQFNSDLNTLVLPDHLEGPLVQHYFQGHMKDLIEVKADNKGVVRMYLDGVKVMFTTHLSAGRMLAVIDGHKGWEDVDVSGL